MRDEAVLGLEAVLLTVPTTHASYQNNTNVSVNNFVQKCQHPKTRKPLQQESVLR